MTRREARELRERQEAAAAAAIFQPTVDLETIEAELVAEPETEPEAGPAVAAELTLEAAPIFEAVVEADAVAAEPIVEAAPTIAEPLKRERGSRKPTTRSRRSRPQSSRPKASRPKSRTTASVLPALSRGHRSGARALLAKLMSFGAMVGVAGMLVATSVPANAFFGGEPADMVTQQQLEVKAEVQSIGVSETAALAAKATARDGYEVVSLADQLFKKYGNQTFSFTNNPNGTIQWPFATSVPISSGFGARMACSYCSSNHMGVDFTPGAGAPIQAIADGVVSDVIVEGGGLGVHVIIDHVINGQNIQSYYGHMKWGSPTVAKGQAVTVGQYIGDVGSTGASTGAHLHLEIHVEGTPVDPFAWLKANAN